MKVHVEIDCSPQEARQFLGLPDVGPVNDFYVEGMVKAMQGATNFEQMQELARQFTPVGEAGLKMFRDLMQTAAAKPGPTRDTEK